MVVFDSVKSRDEFASKFPKSLNVTSSVMFGTRYGDVQDMGIPLFYPYCSVRISYVNMTTGHNNETGYKRMNRFYDAILKQYDAEGSVDLFGMMEKYALLKLPNQFSFTFG